MNVQGGEEEEEAVKGDSDAEIDDEDTVPYSADVVDESDEENETTMAMPPKKKAKKGSQWESL